MIKTSKKVLSLILAIIMLMSTSVVISPASAFAAGIEIVDEDKVDTRCAASDDGLHSWKTSDKIAPTCQERGYTFVICEYCLVGYRTDFKAALGHDYKEVHSAADCITPAGTTFTCQREGCGDTYFVADQGSEALGHTFSDWYFDAQEDGKYYYSKRVCGFGGCIHGADCADGELCPEFKHCLYEEYEYVRDAEGNPTDEKQVYYKVDFVNEYVTAKKEKAMDGTLLAVEFDKVVLETVYVKKGEDTAYSGITPMRDKTYDYGKYNFLGWVYDEDDASYIDFTNIQKNIEAKAKFQGMDIAYTVNFKGYSKNTDEYNAAANVLTQTVYHGNKIAINPAEYSYPVNYNDPLRFTITFLNWDLGYMPEGYEETFRGDAVKNVPIYSDQTVNAQFEYVAKKYKVYYHYDNGIKEGSLFEYAGKPETMPKSQSEYPKYYKSDDLSYYYYLEGWVYENGAAANLNHLLVPDRAGDYTPEKEENEWLEDIEKGIIHLYPTYTRHAKTYPVTLIVHDTDGVTPVPGAAYQIVNTATGNLVGTGNLDEEGRATLYLNRTPDYDYEISVTAGGNVGVANITKAEHIDPYIADGKVRTVLVVLEKGEGGGTAAKDCTCICHSFFSRIHIVFLNLIYRITGKKVVCCYDMYARHGKDLVYTQF